VTYGKVIGGGMPVGAFGGKMEIMQHIAPLGQVYQAGTLSGNPVAMAAGHTLLSYLKSNPHVYRDLDEKGEYLKQSMTRVMDQKGIPYVINQCGSMISMHFSGHPVIDFDTAGSAHNQLFNQLFHFMLEKGVYLPPSAFETWFISHSISGEDMDKTLAVLDDWSPES
jgi:glutamate-1-semialdehyde 2,1-aminomutase